MMDKSGQAYTARDLPPKDETLRLLLASEEGRRIDEAVRYNRFAWRASLIGAGLAWVFLFVFLGHADAVRDLSVTAFWSGMAASVLALFLGLLLPILCFRFGHAETKALERRESFLAFLRRYNRA